MGSFCSQRTRSISIKLLLAVSSCGSDRRPMQDKLTYVSTSAVLCVHKLSVSWFTGVGDGLPARNNHMSLSHTIVPLWAWIRGWTGGHVPPYFLKWGLGRPVFCPPTIRRWTFCSALLHGTNCIFTSQFSIVCMTLSSVRHIS